MVFIIDRVEQGGNLPRKTQKQEGNTAYKNLWFSGGSLIHMGGKNTPKNTRFYQVLSPGKVKFANPGNRAFLACFKCAFH
jgi:hypothetical protein